MELLQKLAYFLFNTDGGQKLLPILTNLLNGSLNIADILNNINIQTILPLLSGFFNNGQNKNPSARTDGNCYGLKPVVNLADKEIVYTLNRYFCS